MVGTVLIVFAILIAISAGIAVVITGTIHKTRNGINFRRVKCPRCGKFMPIIRRPATERQRLYGGWTCDQCGCEIDKWGRTVRTMTDYANYKNDEDEGER